MISLQKLCYLYFEFFLNIKKDHKVQIKHFACIFHTWNTVV